MAGKYDAVAKRALVTIGKKGTDVTFPGTGSSGDIYDPFTETWSGTGTADASSKAVQIQGDPDRFASLSLSMVNAVTLMVAASGLAVVPTAGMAMEFAGVTYTVKDVDPVAPDGTPIIYTVIGQ